MSKEAMKLALEALAVKFSEGWHEGIKIDASDIMLLNDAAQALAEPDFWEGYVPEPDSTCSNTLRIQGKAYPRTCKKCGLGPCVGLAQQALDKKAENARELGLDYEPAQQEPVAVHQFRKRGCSDWYDGYPDHTDGRGPYQARTLYTSPPAQRTWVGLVWGELPEDGQNHDFLRGAVWAETKLKEKNQ